MVSPTLKKVSLQWHWIYEGHGCPIHCIKEEVWKNSPSFWKMTSYLGIFIVVKMVKIVKNWQFDISAVAMATKGVEMIWLSFLLILTKVASIHKVWGNFIFWSLPTFFDFLWFLQQMPLNNVRMPLIQHVQMTQNVSCYWFSESLELWWPLIINFCKEKRDK